ncbi:Pkinase domain-containing protein/LRR_1 domain-containing protein/LRRNT_2 domain-containing protein/LRR_4 domain-containing protein/LRR_8 domain-containing protein [Cephalotus follicularis]|uniref:Pkinase domain-containing protein/LRR_1 domain-containing protein/LRRNT_2 domain-containing protein/LRR_4 domain-containing protein/LRR_8 domain-containing protein n=1 Tax=Cephalotus follicularis TaxID=3775 RepID=A0A1Q3BV03_CEPFO|nr:Pkinase domain-containing protein/LRR_1 domain-containing protein/LRRNT_2 domain-containing protein/LRR_4 domain-containing protein/LRR_8 domain-containing protein [Cephalotus follicularis]
MNLSLFTFSLCFLSLFLVVSSASESELRCLLEFKKGIRTDPLNKILSTWTLSSISSLHDPSPCPISWFGVSCDPNSGSIVSVNLDRLALAGDLKFSTLTDLKSLQNFSLSGNNFTGRLVPALATITSLQHLDLSYNQFVGPIPGRFSDLWGLNYLNLSGNSFSGGFPVGLRNLQQLRVLDLHSNTLWGDIGSVFGELKNVEFVDLSYNQFYGGLGVDVENVSSLANTLRFLNLSHNGLNGGFFKGEAIGLFRNLEVLDLGDTGIGGELPGFAELTNLKVLRLGNNGLFGPVPPELLQSGIPVEELDLSRNGFTGSIPEINSTTLNVLNLSSNGLSGALPTILRSCAILDLSRNMISDELSNMQNWEANLEVLDLSSNMLSGNFSTLPIQLERLSILNLRNNSLGGNLTSTLVTSSRLSAVDLSLNQLSGPLPGSFFNLMTLTALNLSGNHFTGPIPLQGSRASELLVLPSYPPMESLDLSSNFLTGGLPSDIGNLGRLNLLNLASNDLSGQLPSELDKLSNLEYLDLSGNKFEGEIPNKLPSSLNVFNVSYNNLSGSVPENLKRFPPSSFRPGNTLLSLPSGPKTNPDSGQGQFYNQGKHHSLKNSIRIAIIVASVGAVAMIVFVLLVYHRAQLKVFHGGGGFSSEATARDVKLDRLAGELFFLDASLTFTAEELSRAPAEVLGRSSHGTLYKATLDSGHMLTVKWLRVGLVKHKKEFAKEVKKIGSMRHINIVPLRAYYWGPREQERLLLADFVHGDSLALHLYETTPRRYSLLSFSQRLKVAVDVARCLFYLHDRGLPHGNLKPTNIILAGSDYDARLTDYGLHRLMTPAGIAEQILNLGALGYRAPELTVASKPVPSFKADVYAFGVILMELLTRRSAGDIISGQSGAVDLTDWVRLCDQEGRGMDCIDRDIAGGEEPSKAMDDLLAVSLRCILPINERPNIRQVYEDLCSISA